MINVPVDFGSRQVPPLAFLDVPLQDRPGLHVL